MKPCSKCGVPKELSDFNKRKAMKDGHRNECKLCQSQRHKKWCETNLELITERGKKYREANKERINEKNRKWHEENREHVKKYREANKAHITEQSKRYCEANKEKRSRIGEKWRKANPDKDRSKSARRRSVKLKASPSWITDAEKTEIQEIYTLAIMQSEATGKEYHVDHIHPLQAPKVVMFEGEMIPLICGLHVPANLQILEASVNLSKNNKFEPYIESECDFTELWQVRSDDRTQILIPTPIDRIPRRNPSALIKPRKSRGVSKGQLALF